MGRIHFALLVRFEPEHALAWRERARSSTARTFNELRVAVLKTFEVDGNKPWKGAFGCFARLHEVIHRFYRFLRVLLSVGEYSFPFWFHFSFCFAPILTFLSWSLESFDTWTCSINDPQCITTQHEQCCGFL